MKVYFDKGTGAWETASQAMLTRIYNEPGNISISLTLEGDYEEVEAAQIVADLNEVDHLNQYEMVTDVADRFLRRHATIGELRAAVKAAKGEKELVRYVCVSGYIDAPKGAYRLDEEIEGIGPVQYVEERE